MTLSFMKKYFGIRIISKTLVVFTITLFSCNALSDVAHTDELDRISSALAKYASDQESDTQRLDNFVYNFSPPDSKEKIAHQERFFHAIKDIFLAKISRLREIKKSINSVQLIHQKSPTSIQINSLHQIEQDYLALNQNLRHSIDRIKTLANWIETYRADVESRAIPKLPTSIPESEASHKKMVDPSVNNNEKQQLKAKKTTQSRKRFSENTDFNVGSKFSHYNRSEISLNGFLALDSIFLGDIAVEGVEANTLTTTLGMNHSITPGFSLHLKAPFIARQNTYSKAGVGGAANAFETSELTNSPKLGDVTVGANTRIFDNKQGTTLILNTNISAPTGVSPYGVPVKAAEPDNEDEEFSSFSVPGSLPTGNGVWSFGNTLTYAKISSPTVIFGNIGYTHNIRDSFSDIDSDPDSKTPGDIKLGDAISVGAGIAISLNDKTSISMAYSQSHSKNAKTRVKGEDWSVINGSEAISAELNLGLNHTLTRKKSFSGSLGVGLTDDAPDFTVEVKVPLSN